MRAYFFGNYYLSSIQQGIQAAHCLAEMFVLYTSGQTAHRLHTWAQEHKTMILLNGGNDAELREKYNTLQFLCSELQYPCAIFTEDVDSLNCACTCVGFVVPEKIYKYNEYERDLRKPSRGPLADVYIVNPIRLSTDEKCVAEIIDSAPLAR